MTIAKYYFDGQECIGIDAYLPIDGRLNTTNACNYTLNHCHTKFMRKYKLATHFKIIKTKNILDDGYSVTDLIPL